MNIVKEIKIALTIFSRFYTTKRYDYRLKERYAAGGLRFHFDATISTDNPDSINNTGTAYVGAYTHLCVLNEHDGVRNSSFTIGDGSAIGEFCNIRASGGSVTIGRNVQISQSIHIIASNHGTSKHLPMNQQPWDTRNNFVVIEDDVWVGCQSVILPGTRIGKGAIIGAGSVVKGEIPEYAIAVGVPAKVIKFRE